MAGTNDVPSRGGPPKSGRAAQTQASGFSAAKPTDLSARLCAWLAQAGLEPGTRIGDRRSLAKSWNVSESTVREAVRTLEAAGVLEQRVGVGGGVFLASREAEAMAGVLLQSMALGRASRREAVETLADIEALIAAKAARSADAARLRKCEEAARAAASANVASPGDGLWDTGFHEALADCAGNRVLALLRRALTAAVVERTRGAAGRESGTPREPDHVTYSHSHIMDAVRAGDKAEAARRARRHVLAALDSQEVDT